MQISAVSLQYVQTSQAQTQPAEPPAPPVLPARETDSVELSRPGTPIFAPGQEPQNPAVPGGSVDRGGRGHSVDHDHDDHRGPVGPGDGPGRRVGPRFAQDDPSLSGRRHHDGHHDHGRRVGSPTIGPVDGDVSGGQTVDPTPEPVDPTANAGPGSLGAGDGLTGSGSTVDPQPQPVEPNGTNSPDSISNGQTSGGAGTTDGNMRMSFGESFGNAEFRLSFDGEVTNEALRWFRQGMADEVGQFVDAAGMGDAQRQDFVQAYWDFAHDLRGLIEAQGASSSELADKFHGLFDAFSAKVSGVLAGGVVDVNPIDTGATGFVLDTSA